MKSEQLYNIFVYGTLLEPEFILHEILEDYSIEASSAIYQGRMFSLGACPIVIPSQDPEDLVFGKVYTLTNYDILELLDRYEGSGKLYRRELVKVTTYYGREIETWIYQFLYNVRDVEQIKDGNWLNYKKLQEFVNKPK